jgi:hypothetical protein
MAVTRQLLSKHAPAATNTHVTEAMLEAVFSVQSMPRLYNEDQRKIQCVTNSSQIPLLIEEQTTFQNMQKSWKEKIMVMATDRTKNQD